MKNFKITLTISLTFIFLSALSADYGISDGTWIRLYKNDVTNSGDAISSAIAESDVDKDIPSSAPAGETRNDILAICIGNQKYESDENSNYSKRDAEVFAKYAKSLGIPTVEIFDATYARLKAKFESVARKASITGVKKIVVFFSGHGILLEDKGLSIVPVDHVKDMGNQYLFPLSEIYKTLDNNINVVILFDACAERPEKLPSKGIVLYDEVSYPDNVTVITASELGQKAFAYDAQSHGVFTYYLLDGIKQHGDKLTVRSAYEYLLRNVPATVYDLFQVSQTPEIFGGTKSDQPLF